jgi:hypothetical protein
MARLCDGKAAMKTFTGWQRLLIVISVVWVSGVVLLASYEYQVVTDGNDAKIFVSLKDTKTGRRFGDLSRYDIKRLGELHLKRSKSSNAEPTDAEEGKFFLEAEPTPLMRYRAIACWAILPVIFLWVLYATTSWIAAGFRKAA